MSNWIEVKVRYPKLQDNGTSVKNVTESFLVDALSFTEAEARIIKEREPYISGQFSVSAVKKTKISEIFYGNDDKWWLVKWSLITIDERPSAVGKPPKEKKVTVTTLVQGLDLQDAYECFKDGMKNTLADYCISSVSETAILDVYPVETKQCDGGAE